MKKEIYKLNLSNFVPIHKDSKGKVLTESDLDFIEDHNKLGQDLIDIYETVEEIPTLTYFINMGTYFMLLSRDSEDKYTNIEFTNNLLSYKCLDSIEDIIAQFDV